MVPVADPGAGLMTVRSEVDSAIRRVLDSGYYILGPEVEAFERELAQYIGAEHAVGVANGTDGLALAIRALGIGPGDEIITVSHTAVATVAAIEQSGATPVLVDVESPYLTMDPDALSGALSPRTRAVVPVHIYGQSADMDRILRFCREKSLALIEDCSQAHGATWRGQRLGSLGEVGVFSCYPTKNLGALGDAGIVTTSSTDVANRMRRLRQYGWKDRNSSLEPGVNSRLDELQAAILRVKLSRLNESNSRRQAIAATYHKRLSDLPITVPAVRAETEHVFHLYVVQVQHRERLRSLLQLGGVQSAIHYPVPIHLQPAYRDRLRPLASMQVTEEVSSRVLSIPMFPELAATDVDLVCEALRSLTLADGTD